MAQAFTHFGMVCCYSHNCIVVKGFLWHFLNTCNRHCFPPHCLPLQGSNRIQTHVGKCKGMSFKTYTFSIDKYINQILAKCINHVPTSLCCEEESLVLTRSDSLMLSPLLDTFNIDARSTNIWFCSLYAPCPLQSMNNLVSCYILKYICEWKLNWVVLFQNFKIFNLLTNSSSSKSEVDR